MILLQIVFSTINLVLLHFLCRVSGGFRYLHDSVQQFSARKLKTNNKTDFSHVEIVVLIEMNN